MEGPYPLSCGSLISLRAVGLNIFTLYLYCRQIKMSLKAGNIFLYCTVSFVNTLLGDITEV